MKNPKVAKKFSEHADGSASDSALFKEDLPRKQVFSELWMNKHEMPPKQGRQLEAAEEGTLMGRLASRMAARDMIDELDMGPKGRSPEAKKAQVADNDYPSKMQISGPALKEGTKIESEHKDTIKALKDNPKMSDKDAAQMIAKDHLKENPLYYNKVVGLPAMEKKLEEMADNEFPAKMMVGPGLHEQTHDVKVSNMSDPTPDKGVRKGKNMAEQAKNTGNVFDTMHKK